MAKQTIREIHRGIREGYIQDPQRAQVEIRVSNVASDLSDPLHCAVRPEAVHDVVWQSGAHPPVGGVSDVPCSADLLPLSPPSPLRSAPAKPPFRSVKGCDRQLSQPCLTM